ncbi:dimethyladenosine transferase [Anaeromyxobacter sp. K]|uniref:Ribosomal RNA small subunit methyltransferase A n=2 Tax=Anaeromyxobacter TaxID=161492 RepID=RSMA_ANAD2|nr:MULTISPECIES: 16S rRNA (adenine(1518)-N(6)/adenine(1519)-N(6))-dimethyltransferase RsmA [Anaeromyxobacter]B4UDZ6.1 RecName: Full=Ribosomal RNA small subunit methyltransferase A; AltName: Full=16S rRNA (adenine(1518)-N(6)/adenine(1519)-N(6))-dimethyltransferase; AltName: Full=16S rRNA dimethyladenosine transferase; AltName: Full=16S rRNA dimethylase; AltName: Full=S-adenosylmethionine-6-N', N'-adenosyl(rRNA) dimethyltransferase [Anaeromyxobacter sp. K]B8J7H0.1 RecName: Full=Ribosomal RNA small 
MTDHYPSPRALLDRYDLRAKKSWGQNFLGDEAVLDDIARLAAPRAGDAVLELGAGLGHLTARLLARGARVAAVERDRDMVRVLRGELGDRITLLEADAARLDYADLAARFGAAAAAGEGPRLAVVGNLPYHLTSPILFSILDQVAHVSRAVFLLQREVAERLAAPPASRDWGVLSVLLQREADVSVERIVPPGAFWPPPKVASAVLCALFRPPADAVADPARFRRLVKAGFGQRRKTLRNALGSAKLADPARLEAAFAAAGVDPGRRGETLTLAEWAALERTLG